jgi:glyoxylase-like metal-dependent hydrolase (beta-lactamase superfamily II)
VVLVFFKQVKYRGGTFTYIVADESSGEAVVIDPSFNANAVIPVLEAHRFSLKYIVDTHGHVDHTATNEKLKKAFHSKIIAHELSGASHDVSVSDGDVIRIGKIPMRVIYTPGHSSDGICLLVNGKLFTGDTLLVGLSGRTDLPGGSPEDMNASLQKLARLDGNIEVYPGHDVGSSRSSTIAKERQTNPAMQNRTVQQFILFSQTHSRLNRLVLSSLSRVQYYPVMNRLFAHLFLMTQGYLEDKTA